MTKKRQDTKDSDAALRQSRKEILIARKHEEDIRTLRIALGIVFGLVAIVALLGIVNEAVITPQRPVITLGTTEIPLRDWQDRVRYERAQRIIFLDNQLESFGGDVGIVQQFGSQVLNDLVDPNVLGQTSLDAMSDEAVICNALEERGITITDADIDAEIGASYSYYGGLSPTALPEPTQTVMPTPSLTPIPVASAGDAQPTDVPQPTATTGPPATPVPSPTPVSEASFQEEISGVLGSFKDLGVDEATYRSVVRAQLCRDKLAEALATEQNLSTIAPHTSLFLMAFDSEEEALAAAEASTSSEAYLTAWNTIRSQPDPASDADAPTSGAFELLWRSPDNLEGSLGPEAASVVNGLAINEPSGVITIANGDGTSAYYVVMVSGREDRELAQSELDAKRQELVQAYVDEAVIGNLVIDESWRNHVPTTPRLDPKFLAQPTALPTPTIGVAATEVPATAVPVTPDGGE